MSRYFDPGPSCRTCGYARINVVHDGETERARAIETWAFATPAMGGQDYYKWAGVKYHPFEPATPDQRPVTGAETLAEAYERGYQAGYHAARRKVPA